MKEYTDVITFTVFEHELLTLELSISSLWNDQILLHYMKDKKGLICKGVVHLTPVGEVISEYNKKNKCTHYWQYPNRK